MSSEARVRDVERNFDAWTWSGVGLLVRGVGTHAGDRHGVVELVLGVLILITAAVRCLIATDRAMRGEDD